MARSILRAGKIAGVIIVAIIVVAAVLYSAGVLSIAQGDQAPAPIEPAGAPVETADARAAASLAETVQKHMRAARYDAVEGLCNDAIARAPGTDEALRARQSLAELYIRTHNDQGADAAVDEMVAVFADHKRIAGAVCEVGDEWRRMRKFADAQRLYSYVTKHLADDPYSIWSQKNLCTLHVQLGDDTARDAAVDQLLTNYGDHPDLPLAICSIGDEVVRIRKDYEKARELYAFAATNLSDNSQAVWAQKNLCKLLVERIKDTDAAQAETDKLFNDFADNPNLPAAALETADAWRGKKHISEAQAIYERIVTDHPKSVQALWSQKNICAIYAAERNESAADSALDEMVATFAESDQLPKAVCETADAWRSAGRIDKAAALYEYVTAAYPSNWHTIWSQKNLCTLHAESGDTQAADEALNKLITTHPQNDQLPKAICEVADAYRNSDNPAKARQLYNQIIDTYPAHTWALWSAKNLISMDIELLAETAPTSEEVPGEVMAGLDELISSFGTYSDITPVVCYLGEQYYQKAFGKDPSGLSAEAGIDFRKAIAVFARVIDEVPFNIPFTGDAHYMTGVAYSRLGEYDNAIAYHQAVVDNWPEHHLAWSSLYWIGNFYQKLTTQGLLTTAEADAKSEEAFLRLFEEYPNTPMIETARSQLAMIYFRAKRWEEAVSVYEQIIQEAPPDDKIPKSTFYLARAYERMGQEEMALLTYREFLEAWPELSSAKHAETAIEKLGGQD